MLCDTVPTLRDDINEEGMAAAVASGRSSAMNGGKRGRGRAKIDEGDKIDGRAGPRSENIILCKTIDYINDLLSERATLLSRLNSAKEALPPGHPESGVNDSPHAVPLWERHWDGGEGNAENDGEDDDST